MRNPKNWLRVAAAFILSPLIASALVAVVTAMLFYEVTEKSFAPILLLPVLGMSLTIGAFAALIAVPATLSIGLVVHTMFQRRGVTALWAYILAGALIGALIPTVLELFLPGGAFFLIQGVPAGIITALLAWLIRRPDRDTANPTTSAP